MFEKRGLLFLLLNVAISVLLYAKTLNPLQFGLREARNGEERFEILRKCHATAIIIGADVSYQGIDTIYLEITPKAGTIPLSERTDFAGVKVIVRNNSHDMHLFRMESKTEEIDIDKRKLKKGTLLSSLRKEPHALLLVEDKTPWVNERKGYGHAVYRKDMLLLHNGVIQNDPVTDYNSKQSKPSGSLCPVNGRKKYVRNVCFVRDEDSKYKTRLVDFVFQYNVELSNVETITPDNDVMYGDAIISFHDCCKSLVRDVKIRGSYSQILKYGYGITISGNYDITIDRMYGHAKWGIFYMDNTQKVVLKNSDVNRFDCHCYGRDFKIDNTILSNSPSAYSSMYGDFVFTHCTFNDTDPVGLRQEYNANTPFNIYFKHCVFNVSKKHDCFVRINGLINEDANRVELLEKNLPNISVTDCKITLLDDIKDFYFFVTGDIAYKGLINNLSFITVKGLKLSKKCRVDISNRPIQTKDSLKVIIKGMYYREADGKKKVLQMNSVTIGAQTTVFCNGKGVDRKFFLSILSLNVIFLPICLVVIISFTFFHKRFMLDDKK